MNNDSYTDAINRFMAALEPPREHPDTPDGPWNHEPDKKQWTTRVGLPGLIVRNRQRALCGYVAVNTDHPLYGTGYYEAETTHNIHAHGGLTYSNTCQKNNPICHVPEPGQPNDVWWFGFDCAHVGDYLPIYNDLSPTTNEVYRDIHYVTQEVEKLAQQIASVDSCRK